MSLAFMNLLQNFHLAVVEYLYRGRRAVSLQTFISKHSNRKLSIVMALSTTFMQCIPETIKFSKITQNMGHFAVQGHFSTNRIESLYTASYVNTIARQVLRNKSRIYESATEFPPCRYRIFIPWASCGSFADFNYLT